MACIWSPSPCVPIASSRHSHVPGVSFVLSFKVLLVCVSMDMCGAHVYSALEARRECQSPWSWSCRLQTAWCGCLELNPGPQQEQQALLAVETALQPPFSFCRDIRTPPESAWLHLTHVSSFSLRCIGLCMYMRVNMWVCLCL